MSIDHADLPDDWLATELAAVRGEIAMWSNGLKESYNSLPGVTPIPLGLPACPFCGSATPHPLDCEGCAGWGYIDSAPRKLCDWCKGSGRVPCPPRSS